MKQKLTDVQHTLATVTQDLAHIVQRINGCVSLLESVIRENSPQTRQSLSEVVALQSVERGLSLLRDTVSNHSRILSDMTRPKAKSKPRTAKEARRP